MSQFLPAASGRREKTGSVEGCSYQLDRTLTMMGVYMNDLITHMYGMRKTECKCYIDPQDDEITFAFQFKDTNRNTKRFNQFLDDVLNCPDDVEWEPIEQSIEPYKKLIKFKAIDDIPVLLEQLSIAQGHRLDRPLDSFFKRKGPKQKVNPDTVKDYLSMDEKLVTFLKRDFYASVDECRDELVAAGVSQNKKQPHHLFIYSLQEIERATLAAGVADAEAQAPAGMALFYH